MRPIRQIFDFLRSKILGAKDLSVPAQTRLQNEIEHPGISEEFKQRVDDFIERYRKALEALAKE